jgi:hypothetical protein
MYKYSLKFFTLILALLICGCANRLPTSPIKVPVSLNKAGTIIDMDFRVKRDYTYSMILRFFYTKDGKYEYGVGYNEDSAKLRTLMGDSFPYDKNGNLIKNKTIGVPIPIKLTVTSLLDNKIFYQSTIVPHLTSWGGGFFAKWLASITLHKGVYHVSVENLNAVAEFDNTPVVFILAEAIRK